MAKTPKEELTYIELEAVSRVLVSTQEQKLVNALGFFILQSNAVISEALKPYLEMRKNVQTHSIIEKFTKEKEVLLVKHAEKDEQGKPVIVQGPKFSEYKIDNQPAFAKELEVLMKKHEKDLIEYDSIQAKFAEMGKEVVELEFKKKISYKSIPDSVFSVQDLFTLQPLIAEPVEDWEA